MASYIWSPVDEVNKLVFHPLPAGRVLKVAKAVKVGRTHVFLDAEGRIYSTQVHNQRTYVLGSLLHDTIAGCIKLGVLSKDAVAKHTKACVEHQEREHRRFAAQELADAAKRLGVTLSTEQKRAVRAAQKAVA
jgi:hypothetical protein